MITITDDMMHDAMAILASDEHAKAKAAHEKTEREAKVLLARLGKEANDCKTEAARQAFALCHPYYGDFLERQALVARAYYEARDRRDSAEAVTRAWQTLKADARAAERVR
jgi:hypothetical protein